MKESETDLLKEIQEYIVRRGLVESTFGRLAAGDGTFTNRLRSGRVTFRIARRVRQYMLDNPVPEKEELGNLEASRSMTNEK